MKAEIKGFYRISRNNHMPCSLKLRQKLWWQFVPGVVIKVRWPVGIIRVGPSHRLGWTGIGEYFEYVESADPNDHYRPWLEENIGPQGWNWNWGMVDNDAMNNTLTIKIRQRYSKYATIAALKWS